MVPGQWSLSEREIILWHKHGQDLSILSFCLLYLFVWPVSLWVLFFFCYKTFEITEII